MLKTYSQIYYIDLYNYVMGNFKFILTIIFNKSYIYFKIPTQIVRSKAAKKKKMY